MFVGGEALEVTDPARTRLPEKFHELVEYGILASKKDPFDPMERELRQLGTDSLSRTEHIHGDWTLLREYPLSRELLALSQVWQSVRGKEYVIAAKGAPEAMADLCHFSADRSAELSQAVGKMADCGLRVLGVARARFQGPELPTEQHAFAFEFLGLVGFSDPIRPSVPAAIQLCYQAGIRVIMITGDYPGTARFIAQQVGLSNLDEVITGSELNALSDEQLRARIAAVNIFARVVPEQKLRIVQALKANNEIVAMTGDGVNDAPALKAAHIGIAMGGRGTDVARESASLVLLDDDFSSIVAAIRMGRRTFDNLKKAMAYIFAVHVPIVGMSLIPVLFKQPLVLFPVHVLFLELIIDPSCSVVFEMEGEEPGVMKRKPRNPNEPLFSGRLIGISLLQGVSALIVVYAVYALALSMGRGETQTRALAFTTMILSNLALIVVNRSWTQSSIAMFRRRNSALWWVLGGAAVMLSVVLFVPFVGRLFKFAALPAIEIVLCLAAAVVGVAWFELAKIVRARRTGRGTA
jgi:Ca2+-transporting ATPase